MAIPFLRLVLLLRAGVDIAFAGYLLFAKPHTAHAITMAIEPYAFAEGVMALVAAVVTITIGWRKDPAVLASLGGFFRIMAALAIWRAPGLSDFPVTWILFVGVFATLGFSSGVLDIVEANRLRADTGWRRARFLLAVEGLTLVGLAVFVFVTPPLPATLSLVLVIAAALEACALLLVGLGPLTQASALASNVA